jgi:tetratricopeptide (TPR) repeat protein
MKPDRTTPSTGEAPRDDGASSSRRSSRRRRRNLKWIVLGAIVVILGLGALTAKPAWRAVKGMRAQRFLAQAEEHAAREEWTQAFERSRSALQLAPTHPKVLRHAAELHARFGAESALVYYQKLLETSSATDQDREGYAAAALGLGDTGLAGPIIEDLLSREKPSARALMLGAQYYSARRDAPRALELARQAAATDPNNPTNAIVLGNFLSMSRRPQDQAEGLALLLPHARAEGPHQLRALTVIARAPETPREAREEVESILAAKAQRTPEEDLLLMETRVSLDPSRRNEIADEVVQKHGRGAEEQMAGAAAWLNRQQLYSRTVSLLLPDIALQSPRLTRLRYEALMGMENIQGAYDFIRGKDVKGEPIQLELLRCTTAMRLKNDAAVESHLRNLLDLARRNPRQLRAVAEFARRNNHTEIANEANQILSRNPGEAMTAFESLLRTADAEGETWAARDYARKLAALKKGDDGIRLQIAFYDLLLEENLDQAFATAQELHKAKPEDFNRRAVLALAHLRRGEPDKAVALIEGQVVTWRRLTPGVRAIVVASLGANNRAGAVPKLLQRLPLARLKPEERELIKPYLTGDLESVEDDRTAGAEAPEKI